MGVRVSPGKNPELSGMAHRTPRQLPSEASRRICSTMSVACSRNAQEIKMTRSKLVVLAAITFAASVSTAVAAQGVRMTIRPDSKLALAGSSNVHDWSCKSAAFIANVEMDSGFVTRPLTQVTHPISKVEVTIPIKTLKCGHSKMDSNMY